MKKDVSIIKKYVGVSLVEILLSIALISFVVLGLSQGFVYTIQSSEVLGYKQRAVFLANEGLEAIKGIRDESYALLADGNYGVSKSGSKWELVANSDTTGEYTRVLNVATVDSNTKTITSTITWTPKYSTVGSYVVKYDLTNYKRATVVNWTTPTFVSSFDLTGTSDARELLLDGTKLYVGRATTANSVNDINISNELIPTLSSSVTATGTPTGLTKFNNLIYVSSGDNTREIQYFTNSPTLVLSSFVNLSGNTDAIDIRSTATNYFIARTNGFLAFNASNVQVGSQAVAGNEFSISINGNYAYIGTNNNANEVAIINITNPASMSQTATINLPGSLTVNKVLATGNTLYIGTSLGMIYIYNITNPATPTLLSSVSNGAATINAFAFNSTDNLLYVGSSDATTELNVYNVSTLASPNLHSTYNAPGVVYDLIYNSSLDRLYMATASDTQELIILKSN